MSYTDEAVKVPAFLEGTEVSDAAPAACSFCSEIACETDAMACGCAESSCQTTCEGTCQTSCEKNAQSCGESSSPEDPTWSVSTTSNSITVTITDRGDYRYFSYSLRNASNTTILEGPTDYASTRSYTFSGLDPQTRYRVYVSWSTSTTGEGNYDWEYATTNAQLSVPYWDWTKSNGTATAAQTQLAYTAVTTKLATRNFRYTVWNDLVYKVADILDALGYTWNSRYAALSGTLMTSTDRTLTAGRFNSLRYNVGLHYSTGISEVSSGDTCYGSYFTTLTDKINDWIDEA